MEIANITNNPNILHALRAWNWGSLLAWMILGGEGTDEEVS